MRDRNLLVLLAMTGAALTACGGGGSSGGGVTPQTGPTPAAKPTPAGQQQQTISNSGGTVTAAIAGGGTLTVTVPSQALSGSANVTVYAFTSLSQIAPLSTARRAMAAAAVPNNGVFLGGFAIDTGDATVLAPLQVSEPPSASVPSGDVVRVARYNGGSYSDVDTATFNGTTLTNDASKAYVSVSGGGLSHPYIFYAVPAASAPSPAPIVVTAIPGASQLDIGGIESFTATGHDANGNPLPFTPSFSTDNTAVATVAAGTNPLSATVTASSLGGSFNLLVTDPRTSATAKLAVTVLSDTASAGASLSFSGTKLQNDVYTYPSPTLPPTAVTTNVTQNVTVSSVANPYGAGNVNDLHSVEADAAPTQTQTSTADYYEQTVPMSTGSLSQVELLGYNAVDDQGNKTAVTYPSPLVLDEMPDAAGLLWTNSPAEQYNWTSSGTETDQRTVNADGTYTETDVQARGSDAISAADAADYSGQVAFQFSGSNGIVTETWQLSPPASGAITATIVEQPLGGAPKTLGAYSVPAWFATTTPLYSETDVDNGPKAFDAKCGNLSALGTQGDQLVQTIAQLDPAQGTMETTTTTAYNVVGFGPVCVIVADDTQSFYDYKVDVPYSFYYDNGAKPLQDTTISETLAINPSTSTTGAARRGMTAGGLRPIPNAEVAMVRTQLRAQAHRARMKHLVRILASYAHAHNLGGLR